MVLSYAKNDTTMRVRPMLSASSSRPQLQSDVGAGSRIRIPTSRSAAASKKRKSTLTEMVGGAMADWCGPPLKKTASYGASVTAGCSMDTGSLHACTSLPYLQQTASLALPLQRLGRVSPPTSVLNSARCPEINATFRTRPPSQPAVLRLRSGPPPLPSLSWCEPTEVWNLMCWKEVVYSRDAHCLQRHPDIQCRMRTILVDWIAEVCDVYKLHRESFYLAVDFTDRFLSKHDDLPKLQLQLVGVTALFIASKLEEIYPPKIGDFAYVTDGACGEEDIRQMELVMCKALEWSLAPVTVTHWLRTYLQLVEGQCASSPLTAEAAREFVVPVFHRSNFVQLSRLTDLCMLDEGCLHYPYGMIAAVAIYCLFEPADAILSISGYKWAELSACAKWMAPMASAVRELADVALRADADDAHNLQSHTAELSLLDRARELAQVMARASPLYIGDRRLDDILPTPPQDYVAPSPPSRQPSACRF